MNMEIDTKNFGNRLKFKIKENNLSQKDLAITIGISKTAINNYTQGRLPEAEILYKISSCLNTTMEWLVTGKDTSNNQTNIELDELEKRLLKQFNKLNRDDKLIALGQISMFVNMSLSESFTVTL